MAIHSQILIGPGRMRRPLIGAKGFRSFHWTRGTNSRKVMEACKRRRIFFGVYGEKKERGRGSVRKVVSSYVWRCSWKGYGKNEAWNGVVCSK
jgi:hypothetical protein